MDANWHQLTGNYFARVLAQHYTRVGRRYLFKAHGAHEALTLSQLADLAWDRLYAHGFAEPGIDKALLSQVTRGIPGRRLNVAQLEAICDILQLSPEKRYELQLAQLADSNLGMADVVDLAVSPATLEQLEAQVADLESIRTRGDPALVVRICDRLISDIMSYLRRASTESSRFKLQWLCGQAHMERYRALSESLLPNESVGAACQSAAAIQEAAVACNDRGLWAMSQFVVGSGYYLAGAHELALSAFEQAMGPDLEVGDHVWTLRGAMLDAAHIGSVERLKRYESELLRLAESGEVPPAELLCIYEGIGRARAWLQRPGVEDMFQSGRDHLNRLLGEDERAPFRMVQLAYSELVASEHNAETDRARVEALGRDALLIAETHGYARHKRWIEARLKLTSLNSKIYTT